MLIRGERQRATEAARAQRGRGAGVAVHVVEEVLRTFENHVAVLASHHAVNDEIHNGRRVERARRWQPHLLICEQSGELYDLCNTGACVHALGKCICART